MTAVSPPAKSTAPEIIQRFARATIAKPASRARARRKSAVVACREFVW
ncbi:MAG: hypothetical protein WAL38_28135 [Solirubrobacteraceae bacterium]